ncbi:hypothetical protein [Actinomyces sp. oral taxon 171]|uniref:hypothetical protein n=1 Tax=Actinomyces sp. oral taxon 171 TaxID=706438 RepID=UPI0001F6281F|nr:hypothetical protein [Actinomyces sp. oral taxon 171]EFW25554.1 hypothetical protein HMPREF9057_03092 [Actinomyces sp. oral taxon 171 str. F0337]QCT33872.1 hypothetical protein FBF36_10740 [Actinomyces sp. oral taxon 171 str. F0337]
MRGDLRASTKYIDWALVPSRWIERRFLIFTALRNPSYILLHLFLFLPLTATAGIAAGVLLAATGASNQTMTGALVLGGLLVASLMAYRLLSFTVFNASGVHIFRFIGCWWWRTDIPWVTFRETARVNLDRGLRMSNGLTPPDTHNLALHLTTMEEWARFVGAWAVQGDRPDPLAGLPLADRLVLAEAFEEQHYSWPFDDASTIVPGFVRQSHPDERRQEAQERIARDWRALIEWAEQKQYLPRRLYPFESYPGFLPW